MSVSFYLDLFKNLPPELSTMLIATLPIGELRASIPIALEYYELSVTSAYAWSVIGNMIPAVLLIYFIGRISDYLSKKSKLFKKFFGWLFKRTQNKFNSRYEKYGMLALTLFVAIPLPITGVWTGSIAAWLFGLPRKKSLAYIFAGVLIAGIVVSLLSLGVFNIF
jgi:uncharacterized membrane protein